jgi:Mg/Co/Ni transporter MgtE
VLPTLPMFAAFPFLLERLGFWPTLGASVLITLASFGLCALFLKRFGIHLL